MKINELSMKINEHQWNFKSLWNPWKSDENQWKLKLLKIHGNLYKNIKNRRVVSWTSRLPPCCLASVSCLAHWWTAVCFMSFSWRLCGGRHAWASWEANSDLSAYQRLCPNGYGIICYDPHHGALGEAVCRLYLNKINENQWKSMKSIKSQWKKQWESMKIQYKLINIHEHQ